MEDRDRSIITQVAFKATTEFGVKADLDLTDPDGQAQFESMFSFLLGSLVESVAAQQSPAQKAAAVMQTEFPGSVVTGNFQQTPADPFTQPAAAMPSQDGVKVKGTQFGPLPDWLLEQAAEKGVTEVYDNRDRVAGTRRPWFRSTAPGDDQPAFWPPK